MIDFPSWFIKTYRGDIVIRVVLLKGAEAVEIVIPSSIL